MQKWFLVTQHFCSIAMYFVCIILQFLLETCHCLIMSDDESLLAFEYINRIELLMLINEKVGSSFNLSLKR